MDRVAVLVDAGYFFAAGSALVSGSGNQRRDSLIFDEKSAVKELEALAQRVSQNSPLLRIYWYDGASRKTGPTAEHSRLAHCNNIKVRLGFLNSAGRAVASGLFGHPLRDPARRKVHHQSFSHTLFMHDDSPLRHRASEAIVPSRHDGFVAPQRYSVVCGRRQVVRDPEAPGLRPEFTHHEIANDQTSPIEVPVISQPGTGGGELGEQGLLGG